MTRVSVLLGTMAGLLAVVLLFTPAARVRAGDIGYVEEYALAKDRAASLKQLIPGTDDYYYFHSLHLLQTEQFERVEPLTVQWYERHKQTPRLTEIQTRHALLTFDKNPEKSLRYIRDHLGARFDHQKEVAGATANLPTALDPNSISRGTLKAAAFSYGNLSQFEESALDWVAADNLSWENRRELLTRLVRPDLPNLPKLVADDLDSQHSGEFGGIAIHTQMTLAQLEVLVNLKPAVLNHAAFVTTYASKLNPGADDDWKRDRKLSLAYLERLQTFADRLSAVHNPFKAHVLYHRLAFDRAAGVYDRARFLAYLKLPRGQGYMPKARLESPEARRHPADLNAEYFPATLLPKVGTDEALVRSCLAHFFVEDTGSADFDPYILDTYLTALFAETKLVNGLGDSEKWASKLSPEALRQLKDRVDIDFAFTNKTEFAVDEPIKIELFAKNTGHMLVKVYEINTKNYYRTHGKEIDTDINLDGLVANAERTLPGNADPFRRTAVTLEFPDPKGTPNFPEKERPGVYVVDLIGGGKSSRALIRKGRLRPVVTTGTAGQVVRVVDETNKLVTNATVWLGGQEYAADKTGAVVVPFSTAPGRKSVVVSRGDFSCLDYLQHQPESLYLTAGIHADREALLSQRIATLLIRPGLSLNGKPVSVGLLEDIRLRITSIDNDGVPTSTELPNFKLFEDRESTHDFRVPPRLSSLSVTLSAKVKVLSTGKPADLVASQSFAVNAIDKTERVEELHFAKFGNDYVLELLGRSGEQKADRPVYVSIKHRDFKQPVTVTMKTDAKGRVLLGALPDVTGVNARGPDGVDRHWDIVQDRHTYRQLLHAKLGEVVTVPYLGKAARPTSEELALFEVQGANIRADKFDAISFSQGRIELKGLAAGDYDLWLKRTGEKIRVRVSDATAQDGYLLGKMRQLQLAGLKAVQIESITADAKDLVVQLRDASKFARVHVFATRYQPAFSAFNHFGAVRDAEPDGLYPLQADSLYLTGRNIGDEYRYVLDRRTQKKYPGNMLERPMLLLNPWAVRTTETGEQLAQGGDQFGGKGGVAPPVVLPPPPPPGTPPPAGPTDSDSSDLDFLYDASAVAVNLTADANGVVRVPVKDFGPHAMIHVVACDPLNTTVRSTSLPEQAALFADLRLKKGLDPAKHFTQQKQVTVVDGGKEFVLEDAAGSRFEAYDSLAKVYSLYATLSKDPKLTEFAFVLKWPKLKAEEKRTLYSKHACHELNFFLSKKDPEFFNVVVKPYLANKKDKTFLDARLLDADLTKFTKPWEFGRLNVPERVFLAQKIAGEPAKTARHLGDLLKLIPPNTDRELFLFDTSVSNSALDTPDGNSIVVPREMPTPVNDPKGPAAEKPAPAPGGFPGPSGGSGLPATGAPKPGDSAPGKDGEGKQKGDDGKSEPKRDVAKKKETEYYFGDDRKAGAVVRQLYRKIDPTMEWAENNYYKLLIQQQVADLVPVNTFWADYAKHADGGFLTPHIPVASRNFTEMMLALAVLDLPFEAGKHKVAFDGGKMTLTPGSRLIAYHEEVRPAVGAGGQLPILVSQNFYRSGDRFREENGEKLDKFVTKEFVIHTVYGCQVVVTNPTSSRQKLSVLLQLPVGAVPVANGRYTKAVPLDLEPYHTRTIDYAFYFPQPGQFVQFPVHVAKNEQFVIAAKPATFNVVAKATQLDTTSWDYVSQHGSSDDVLAFLNRENVRALNLDKIAFRMKDHAFFESVLKLLSERHLYQPTLWSYGLFHADVPAARQYLLHLDSFVATCGGPIESPLLGIDPVARHTYEHLEYKPLVNARAHSLGNRRQIVNDRFHGQYHAFLKTLTYSKALTDADLLAVTYYLLLQDRIDEAVDTFARVHRDLVPTKMQYDYCAAYLEMFTDDPKKARSIAAQYASHPVDRWRNTFAAILAQLDEIEGKGPKVADKDDRDQQQGQFAATEPGFEVALDGKTVKLAYQNLETVRVNYYPMDVELLFSTNPFVTQSGGQFANIRPNASKDVKLPKDGGKADLPLPAEFANRNVLVEVTAAGKTRAVPYYATAMTVNVTENYGQLKASDTAGGKGSGKVYVKVYAKLANGEVKFHKDGYTDLRGRFDYVSVNTPERQAIERFAILVLSEDKGALIREAAPPPK